MLGGIACVASSPTVAWRRSSKKFHSPSLKSEAIFLPCLISISRSTFACVRSISISVDLATSFVISGVDETPDRVDSLCCKGGLSLSALPFAAAGRLSCRGGCCAMGVVGSAIRVGDSSDSVRVCLEPENTVLLEVRVPLSKAFLRSISCCHVPTPLSTS